MRCPITHDCMYIAYSYSMLLWQMTVSGRIICFLWATVWRRKLRLAIQATIEIYLYVHICVCDTNASYNKKKTTCTGTLRTCRYRYFVWAACESWEQVWAREEGYERAVHATLYVPWTAIDHVYARPRTLRKSGTFGRHRFLEPATAPAISNE